MRFRLNRRQSITFTVVYILVTLVIRFAVEPYLMGNWWISIAIGLYFVVVYWALYKKGILRFSEGDGAPPAEKESRQGT